MACFTYQKITILLSAFIVVIWRYTHGRVWVLWKYIGKDFLKFLLRLIAILYEIQIIDFPPVVFTQNLSKCKKKTILLTANTTSYICIYITHACKRNLDVVLFFRQNVKITFFYFYKSLPDLNHTQAFHC